MDDEKPSQKISGENGTAISYPVKTLINSEFGVISTRCNKMMCESCNNEKKEEELFIIECSMRHKHYYCLACYNKYMKMKHRLSEYDFIQSKNKKR